MKNSLIGVTLLLWTSVISVPAIDLPPSLKPKIEPGYPRTLARGMIIKNARFGIWAPDISGIAQFQVASEVPLKDGVGFGWVVEIETSEHAIETVETLTLPTKPDSWGPTAESGESIISEDGKSATTKREYPIHNGIVENFWSIAEGDPAGEYALILTYEGEVILEKSFTVKK
jgi:hypothetical protein